MSLVSRWSWDTHMCVRMCVHMCVSGESLFQRVFLPVFSLHNIGFRIPLGNISRVKCKGTHPKGRKIKGIWVYT